MTHVVFDYGLSPQCSDLQIYELAIQEDRFIVTIDHDFKKIVQKGKPGIFILPSELSNKEIDKTLFTFLCGKNPLDYVGKSTLIR
jgi:predicted nuclease of predicted toxin-antitoxin system